MAQDMPLYGEGEFEDYLDYDEKKRQGLLDPNDAHFKEYSGLVARRDKMLVIERSDEGIGVGGARVPLSIRKDVVRYLEMESGREVFTDAGNRIIPSREVTREDVGHMLDHAASKWGEAGIKINGSGRFKMMVYELAYDRGLHLEDDNFKAYALHRNREIEREASIEAAPERERGTDGGGRGLDE